MDFGMDFACIFWGSWGSFWEDSERQKRFEIHANFHCFSHRFRASFLEAFLIILALIFNGFSGLGQKGRTPWKCRPCQANQGSGPLPEPPKSEQKSIEKSIEFCIKFQSILASFWKAFGLHFGTPKFIDFYIDFGSILAPLGLPFASQNLSKNRSRPPLEHRESLGACPGAWGLPKGTQNGAKIEPWTPKIRSLGTPRPPKRSSRHPQNIPKASQNSFPKMLLKLIQISFKNKKKTSKIKPNGPKL